ncbi:hypothetical protein [Paenarthrobacter nicotinovorans]|uniref:hypothetical protein n=1 Tax=Paenarthrobacter nicotinovorans TaxID=29320 RepID=UPI003D6E9F67
MHPKLDTSVPLPQVVYRVDNRPPERIFRDGFTPRGNNYRITNHALGGANLASTGYVSTTENRDVAVQIATSSVNAANDFWSCDGSGRAQCRTWVYRIMPRNTNFFSLVANLPRTAQFDRYRGQHEWVAADRIYGEAIIDAVPVTRHFTGVGTPTGFTPDGPVVFNDRQTRQNAGHNPNHEGYTPIAFDHVDVGPTARDCLPPTSPTYRSGQGRDVCAP